MCTLKVITYLPNERQGCFCISFVTSLSCCSLIQQCLIMQNQQQQASLNDALFPETSENKKFSHQETRDAYIMFQSRFFFFFFFKSIPNVTQWKQIQTQSQMCVLNTWKLSVFSNWMHSIFSVVDRLGTFCIRAPLAGDWRWLLTFRCQLQVGSQCTDQSFVMLYRKFVCVHACVCSRKWLICYKAIKLSHVNGLTVFGLSSAVKWQSSSVCCWFRLFSLVQDESTMTSV